MKAYGGVDVLLFLSLLNLFAYFAKELKETQNYWVFGLFPSSGILENRKHDVSETGTLSVLRRGKEDTYSVVPLRKSYTQSLGNPVRFTQLFNHLRPG
jgi:hypothetical protein